MHSEPWAIQMTRPDFAIRLSFLDSTGGQFFLRKTRRRGISDVCEFVTTSGRLTSLSISKFYTNDHYLLNTEIE
jgi:hypothetical protein